MAIVGTHLTGATVKVGGTTATVTTPGSTSITIIVPAGAAAGAVNVTVTTAKGTATSTDGFTYLAEVPTVSRDTPPAGRLAGGTPVTIAGTHLTGASSVEFATSPAGTVAVSTGGTRVTARTPAHQVGTVTVPVTSAGGTGTLPTAFTYDTVPATPANVGASAGDGQATVTWLAPKNDGARSPRS